MATRVTSYLIASFAVIALGFVVMLGGLVVIHELGHAAVAAAPERGPLAGYVVYDDSRETAWHAIVIALAGPLAEFIGCLVVGWLTSLHLGSWTLLLAAVSGVVGLVANLWPRTYASDLWSDGRHVQMAWRTLRARPPSMRS